MSDIETQDHLRRRRLRQIADEHTEEIYAERTRAQLSGAGATARYAAVTSEGSAESSYAHNGNLLVAPSLAALATRLASEAAEGWIAHGRVWDLDAPWDPWGNVEVAYRVVLRPASSLGEGHNTSP